MRKVVGEKARKEKEEERMSNQQLREMLGIESVDDTEEKIAVGRSQCEKRAG